jgi:glycine/D-amino acid oxidase-like deaminating enzyme
MVLERKAVACAASGKSGGFLALDWCDGTPLMALARRSFALHAELATSLKGDWGYRRMTTYAGEVDRSPPLTRGGEPEWISPSVAIAGQIGSPSTTAQVHPAALTMGFALHAELATSLRATGGIAE